MQKQVQYEGGTYALRGKQSPTAIFEALGIEHALVKAAACIGLACASGPRIPPLGQPGASVTAYGRAVADKLFDAGWTLADLLRFGQVCADHLSSLIPSHVLPSQEEVDAALSPLDESATTGA